MTTLTADNLVLAVIAVIVVIAIAISWGVIGIVVKDGKRRRTARYAASIIFVALGLLFNWERYQMQSDGDFHASPQEEAYFRKQQEEYDQRVKNECKAISEQECRKKIFAPK